MKGVFIIFKTPHLEQLKEEDLLEGGLFPTRLPFSTQETLSEINDEDLDEAPELPPSK